MIDAVLAVLQADATLSATLTGGVHRAKEISREETPTAYDSNGELLPCALLRQETQIPFGPNLDSSRLFVTVYFYDRVSYTAIETARKRAYTLLHRQRLAPEDGSGNYDVRHADDVLDTEDEGIGVPMAMSRYAATMQRS